MSTASKSVVDLGVCSIEDIDIKLSGRDAAKGVAAINAYLSIFAKPIPIGQEKSEWLYGQHLCCGCGESLTGMMGRFRWGFANGEGTCTNCGWACRAHHYPRFDGETIFDGPIQIILQYRPAMGDDTTN